MFRVLTYVGYRLKPVRIQEEKQVILFQSCQAADVHLFLLTEGQLPLGVILLCIEAEP